MITSLGTLLFAKAQTVLLNDGFESYTDFAFNNFGSWTGLDIDQLNAYPVDPPEGPVADIPNEGGKMAFQIINPSALNFPAYAGVGSPDYTPHSGSKYAGDWAAQMVASGQGNNDWLISPAVTLGSTGNVLTFWVKSVNSIYGNERYKVGIYQGSGSPTSAANFTIVHGAAAPGYALAPDAWTMITVNLDAYAGQTVKVGFNCITQESWMFAIDDVKIVTTGSLATNDVTIKSNSFFPNQKNGIFKINSDKKIKTVEIYDLTGKILKIFRTSEINIAEAAAGVYFAAIKYEDGSTESRKLIKK